MTKFDKVMSKKKQKRSRSARNARLEALMDTQEAYEQHRASKRARDNKSQKRRNDDTEHRALLQSVSRKAADCIASTGENSATQSRQT